MVKWIHDKAYQGRTGIMRANSKTLKGIYRQFLRSQLLLIISLALILGVAGVLVDMHFEGMKRDRNLQNVAETIANSPVLTGTELEESGSEVREYLDVLKKSLSDIDVISIVNKDGIRVYHSDHELIGTVYDGTKPDFSGKESGSYVASETGPSGKQRRAYAMIQNEAGDPLGVAMVIMLDRNIQDETFQLVVVFLLITAAAILIELLIARWMMGRTRENLLGYEPDAFTAMYQMRDNILETLEEGILAVDDQKTIQFANGAAARMLMPEHPSDLVGKNVDELADRALSSSLSSIEQESHGSLSRSDIIFDQIPIREGGQTAGAVAVLHDRAEYTRLMEDLSGTRYLVDSMRANNHDFTNKLHVILGLIQMEMYDKAIAYIQNISMVQRETISGVMNAVRKPAVAALLIGKIARASELNIRFELQEGCRYTASDLDLPDEMLITVIGNLLDNAYEAMNQGPDLEEKVLSFGIVSQPGEVSITVTDTGSGIREEDLGRIFENGYSSKGEGRGTGLYQVRQLVENSGGTITVESKAGEGTTFHVLFTGER